MTLPELIAALEADAPETRELSFWIWWHGASTEAGKNYEPPEDYVRSNIEAPWTFRPMSSIDAAVTLVRKGCMWFVGHIDPSDMRFAATVSERGSVGVPAWRGIAAGAPRAVCIAALRARLDRSAP